MDFSNIRPSTWLEDEDRNNQYLQCLPNFEAIPLLNANDLHRLKDQQLVRFCGMVQDMFNPEYYFEEYEVVNKTTNEKSMRKGKYQDTTYFEEDATLNPDSPNNVTSQRSTIVLITFPGLNDWVLNIERERFGLKPNSSENASSGSSKRSLEETMETDELMKSPENTTPSKRQCTYPTPQPRPTLISQESLLNFPLLDRAGKSCHAKLYNNTNDIKMNDMVEIVGFLSLDPSLSDVSSIEDDERAMETQTHNPPPSLIPRIHCVHWRRISYYNPLCDVELSSQEMQSLKKELHILLTQLLVGDELAAEYLIYHLLSDVYLRTEVLALGKVTLNISNIPTTLLPEYTQQLYEFIQKLVPKSHYFPMTLENMNETAFIPKKDYKCDRITSGLLQLSKNTHLLLDETKLSAGQLNESGVQAVGALANVIRHQRVQYDFNYYQMEFDSDIAFLILSEGKSLLPSDFHVPLNIDETCFDTFGDIRIAAELFLNTHLTKLRIYLTLAKYSKYELSNEMQEVVQNDFVQMRQDSTVKIDDLHQLLVLARLVCLSEGKNTLDQVCWKTACRLEAERKKRLLK